ncbi:hypothetical protein TrispH2_008773 [Trichoplax sp. H2]|nr:hypothetical protein TrispH2_008773 [Trichoplax sp. H2]|eukprot:RDD39494.1 hypothetical protein TrispH2_008773 [Trichoplax sp. H2]
MENLITQCEIDEICSFKDAKKVCKKYAISMEGLKTLGDFKERLGLMLRNETIQNYKSNSLIKRFKGAVAKFREAKMRIIDLLESANQFILQELEPELVDIVKAFDQHYLENIQKCIKHLRNMECPILVTGEVSAGKSSFINLLLNESVLPVGHLHTTTCICELRSSRDSVFKQFTWDSSKKKLEESQVIPIENISNIAAKIKSSMNSVSSKNIFTDFVVKWRSSTSNLVEDNWNEEEQNLSNTSVDGICIDRSDSDDLELTCGKVEIYSDFPLLKDGIFLVDSPGIGETCLATKQIVNYLPNACSIIYIINAANAGGIQEDRLVRLITEEQNLEKEKLKRFSAESAIFICNKWDTIPKAERSTVKNKIKEKLALIWPNFRDSQLITLSTENARSHLKANFVSNDLKAVYSLLGQLLEDSLKGAIVNYSSWFHSLLGVMANRYRLFDTRSFMHNDGKSSYLHLLKYRNSEAKSIMASQNFHSEPEKIINHGTAHISISLLQFLKTEDFKEGMSSWKLEDIPIREKIVDIKKVARGLFCDRFIRLLMMWEKQNGELRLFYDNVQRSLRAQYSDILQAMEDLENSLQLDTSSIDSLPDLSMISSFEEIKPQLDFTVATRKKSWQSFYAGAGIITGTVGSGIAAAVAGASMAEGIATAAVGGVIGGVTGGIGLIISLISIAIIDGVLIAASIDRQRKTILQVMKGNAASVVSELANENKASEIAQAYTTPIRKANEDMRKQIFQHLEANEELIIRIFENDFSITSDIAVAKIDIINKLRTRINDVLKTYDSDI